MMFHRRQDQQLKAAEFDWLHNEPVTRRKEEKEYCSEDWEDD